MNNAPLVKILYALSELSENEMCLALRQFIDTLLTEIAEKVSTPHQLVDDVCFIIDNELLDESYYVGAILTHQTCLAFANLVFKFGSFIF